MSSLVPSTISWIDEIRKTELDFVLNAVDFPIGRLLDIGGGTGAQALSLQAKGFHVDSIDLEGSSYREARVFPIVEYDGHRIPFGDETFDVAFSSNVLEHIAHIDEFHRETMRVLRPGGKAIHIMPSGSWRVWTIASHYVAIPSLLSRHISTKKGGTTTPNPTEVTSGGSQTKRVMQLLSKAAFSARHGERGNRLTEPFYFRRKWWQNNFLSTGWIIEKSFGVPFFYTGNNVSGHHLSLARRRTLSSVLGCASNCFVLRKPGA